MLIKKSIYKTRTFRQLIKFILVGLGITLLDWLMFYFLNKLIGDGQVGKQIAKAISFIISAFGSYYLNRVWTFRSENDKVAREVSKFFIIALSGLVLNNIIFYFITSPAWLDKADIIGLTIATSTVAIWNFAMNKYWTFR